MGGDAGFSTHRAELLEWGRRQVLVKALEMEPVSTVHALRVFRVVFLLNDPGGLGSIRREEGLVAQLAIE